MPPWAAFECERTGWTLEMIPTDAPSSAAREGGALAGEAGSDDEDVVLRASGRGDSMHVDGRVDARRGRARRQRAAAAPGGPGPWSRSRAAALARRPPSARPSRASASRAEQRLERLVEPHAQAARRRRRGPSTVKRRRSARGSRSARSRRPRATRRRRSGRSRRRPGTRASRSAGSTRRSAPVERHVGRDRDRLGVHHVGHARCPRCVGDSAACSLGRARAPGRGRAR